MSLEDFKSLDNEKIDDSILKRDFLKGYHHQGANLNNPYQSIDFVFGENNSYAQLRNAYLQWKITIGKLAVPANPPKWFDSVFLKVIKSDYLLLLLLILLKKQD